MSKGLEKLAIIKGHFNPKDIANKELFEEDFNTIEKELREYEYWSSFVMCYGDIKAEDLQRFIHNGWVYDQIGYRKEEAFDIMKNKEVDVHKLLNVECLEHYNLAMIGAWKLTAEEYNLLKEVLS